MTPAGSRFASASSRPGYLAFPIQMTHRYPELAGFMAGHWATEAVHIVPVFGEKGALLEHFAFRLFYNWPLTLRRRLAEIADYRKKLPSRYFHLPLLMLGSAGILQMLVMWLIPEQNSLPRLKDLWHLGFFQRQQPVRPQSAIGFSGNWISCPVCSRIFAVESGPCWYRTDPGWNLAGFSLYPGDGDRPSHQGGPVYLSRHNRSNCRIFIRLMSYSLRRKLET